MSYRCNLCNSVTPAHQPRLVITFYRWIKEQIHRHWVKDDWGKRRLIEQVSPVRREVSRELSVCVKCKERNHE